MDLKEPDLKKLGIQNSKDRARMLGSLASYKTAKEGTSPSKYREIHIKEEGGRGGGESGKGRGRERERERELEWVAYLGVCL